jgi:serine/threonine protein kinase
MMMQITDFGISRFYEEGQRADDNSGSEGFIAPELNRASANSTDVDPFRCDIFSVGILFLVLLSGFVAPSSWKPARSRAKGAVNFHTLLDTNPVLLKHFQSTDEEAVSVLEDLFLRATKRDPAERCELLSIVQHCDHLVTWGAKVGGYTF